MSRKAVRLWEERMPRDGKLMGLPGGRWIRRCVPSAGGLGPVPGLGYSPWDRRESDRTERAHTGN